MTTTIPAATASGVDVTTDRAPTVRELIAELATLEGQARRIPTLIPVDSSGTAPLNPALLVLADRQRHVIAALRALRAPRTRS